MTDFLMPKLGADMTAGKVVSWRKQPGESVRRGDILAEVETDKGVIEIEAFSDGRLGALLAQPGAVIPVGAPLARLETKDGPQAALQPSAPVVAPVHAPTASAVQQAPPLDHHELSRLCISPSARIRARELNVDPQTVVGSGRHGAITREDIEKAAAQKAVNGPSAASTETVPPTKPPSDPNLRMRQAIAAAMARANQEIPHYYLSTTINLKPALDWLATQNENRPITERMLYSVLLLKATALALREVPELNATWEENRLQLKPEIHLGVAISLRGGGLIAPALHHADRKSLTELMGELRNLVARTRSGKLRSSELSDPTITVTNLGEQGVEAVFGVIYPPQVALVGFGAVVERPWCEQGQITSRPLIIVTLAGDHRATDGHRGGVFLRAIERLLQEPEKL